MFVNRDNWEDCKKYFHGCYVKFREEGDRLFYIETVDPDQITARAVDNSEYCGIDLNIGYTIDYVLPKKTVYQYGKLVVMLARIPARMWKKGLNKQNTAFYILDGQGKWLQTELNPTLIQSFISKPAYYSVVNALNDFQKNLELEAAALTPRISFCRNGRIFVDQTIIARYDFETDTISCKNLFVPELTALFPNAKMKTVK
jgi:hypothetical protein